MHELKKKIAKVLTSKSVGTGPSSCEKRIYGAAVSQRLRNTGLDDYARIILHSSERGRERVELRVLGRNES